MQKFFFLFVVGVFFATPVYAYVEPSSSGMFLQLIFGGMVGILALGKMYGKSLLAWMKEKIFPRK